MNIPRVSVLMSVYNGKPYLGASVESILNQSFKDFEFIVVDDGSTDGSWEFLKKYAERDGRIVLSRNQYNIGVVRALNRCLDDAKGNIIVRQDADDVSHPDRIRNQLAFLDAHPDIGLVAAVPQLVDMDGNIINRTEYTATHNDDIQRLLLDHMCLCGPTIMVRRECLESAGFYFDEGSNLFFEEGINASEDYEICLRLAEVTKLASLEGNYYQYRQQPESSSSKRAAQQMFNKAVALEKALSRRYGVYPPQDMLATLARDYLHAAIIGFIKNYKEQARQCLDEAIRVCPSLLEHDQPLESLVRAYTPSGSIHSAVTYLNGIFNELFPNTKFLSGVRSRLLSYLHMSQVFDGARRGDFTRVKQHIWSAVRYQPSWLLNRGVIAILFRSVFTA